MTAYILSLSYDFYLRLVYYITINAFNLLYDFSLYGVCYMTLTYLACHMAYTCTWSVILP